MSDYDTLVLFLEVLFQYLQQHTLCTQALCANSTHLDALRRDLRQNNLLGILECTETNLVFTLEPNLSIRVHPTIFPVLEGKALLFKTIKEYTNYRFSRAPQNKLVLKET